MSAKKSKTTPDKRRKYDEAFKAEALHLASESRSTQAAAQQLGISPKLGVVKQIGENLRLRRIDA